MGKYALTGAILLVAFAFFLFTRGPLVSSPQQLGLISGASISVGGGRAMMWFAQPDDVFTNGRIVSAARISLTCGGKENPVTVLLGEFSDPVCGVRVKLLKMVEPGEKSRVFRATFEVAW